MGPHKNFKVDFIGIGTPKSATSWLHYCLSEHPEICGSEPKETNFFSMNYKYGLGWYKSTFRRDNYTNLKFLDFSPKYMYETRARDNIFEHNPDAKLLVCLRNPVDQLISFYHFNKLRYTKKHHYKDLEDFVEHAPEKRLGFYYKYLSSYLEKFKKEQIHIILYDDIVANPKKVIKETERFLGINDNFVPKATTLYINKTIGHQFKIPNLRRILYFPYQKLLHLPKIGSSIRKLLWSSGLLYLGKRIIDLNTKKEGAIKPLPKEKLPQEKREKMYDYYKDDIKKLEGLIGQNLDIWKPEKQ